MQFNAKISKFWFWIPRKFCVPRFPGGWFVWYRWKNNNITPSSQFFQATFWNFGRFHTQFLNLAINFPYFLWSPILKVVFCLIYMGNIHITPWPSGCLQFFWIFCFKFPSIFVVRVFQGGLFVWYRLNNNNITPLRLCSFMQNIEIWALNSP